MDTQNKRKYFPSYFCFDKESKFGTVEGRVFSLKSSTYTHEGKEYKRLNFVLASNNIENNIKYILDVEPSVSERNPETIFINCVVFGTSAERLEKFLHDGDVAIATGKISSFEGKSGNRINLKVQNATIKTSKNKGTQFSEIHTPNVDVNNLMDDDDEDEIPF